MSAFFVNDECLTKCVTAALLYADRFGDVETNNGIGRSTPIGDLEREAGNRIGRALRQMNIDALKARYGNRLEPDELDPSYEFRAYAKASPVEMHKAIRCLRYQCAEGDVPDTNPLFNELERVLALIEQSEGRKIDETAEYERASWGD